jgi:hypothetical protein
VASLKSWLGLDLLDLVIHVGATICLMGFVGVADGPEELFPAITLASLLLLGVRRKIAVRRERVDQGQEADRLAEFEERVSYLEGLQDRVVELEERVDFAERLLARRPEEARQLPEGR